ncbi:hypothetical protein MASR1M31_11460 [Porphyromonadaceae bacterium]
MIIGIPKEIKDNENRVGTTPIGVREFVQNGHTVYVQKSAGAGSGFSDSEYEEAGAKLLPTIEEVYAKAEMIVKVKEPIAQEYPLIRQGQTLFTYFHFAACQPLTLAMIESGATCIAYETVEAHDGSLPLLTPMSEIAGKMAAQVVRDFWKNHKRNFCWEEFRELRAGKVLVIGGGVVGYHACDRRRMSAYVTITDLIVSFALSGPSDASERNSIFV